MYNYNIVREPASTLRALGRDALSGKWKPAVIVVLIYEICLTFPPLILNEIFGYDMSALQDKAGAVSDIALSAVSAGTSVDSVGYTPLSGLYIFLVTGAFTLGLSLFFLTLFRRNKEDIAQIFYGFEHFVKAIGLSFMMGLFILLWSLLFLIPGIVAAFRYSQAFFILADDPSKGIMQCIRESKMMMMGNKAKLFFLEISFIGWGILAALPASFIATAVEEHIDNVLVTQLIFFAAGAGILWVSAYLNTAKAAFYDCITGRLRREEQI